MAKNKRNQKTQNKSTKPKKTVTKNRPGITDWREEDIKKIGMEEGYDYDPDDPSAAANYLKLVTELNLGPKEDVVISRYDKPTGPWRVHDEKHAEFKLTDSNSGGSRKRRSKKRTKRRSKKRTKRRSKKRSRK